MITSRASIVHLCAVAALSATFTTTASTWAGPIKDGQLPTVTVSSEDTSGAWVYTPAQDAYSPSPEGDGSYKLDSDVEANGILQGRANVKVTELVFNPDPFVLNNILVTNTLGVPQVFSVFVGVPTSFGAPNLISGNVRTDVIDGGSDGATISTVVGQALYQAQIDFATVASLQSDPFSVVALPGMSNSAAASFGPSANGTAVASNIGIQLRFMLTPGDTASILSRFDVVAIPEPSALVLSGLLVVFVAGVRGRRAR